MVAIRGKKAKASAKPKAAASKAKLAANKEAEADAVTRLTPQQKLTQRREEELLALVRFALQSNLAGGLTLAGGLPVVTVCNTLLTALCAYGKEKTLSPTQILAKLPRTERKRVCGAIFSADEIAYSCRNCQLDTTCVMCKDCFTHSDHAGHDVYFQRTTAGSSCDCGDVHAWKQSGFCSRHKGAEASETGTKKHKLPKHIGQTAPVVIDAVVEHIYQVLLGTEYGFELAEAFELFTRDIPPNLLPIQSDTDVADASESRISTGSRRGGSAAVSTRSTRLSSQITAEPGSRSIGPGGRLEAQANEMKHDATNFDATNNRGVLFDVRLHNDDVHSLNEVISHLYVELGMSKPQARSSVKQVDKQGDATVATKPLLQCPAIVGNLVRRSLNISVAPTWWEIQMEVVPALLEWLQSVSTTSDGLSELVSEALQKQRSPAMRGFLPVSGRLPKGKTVQEFVKERNIRLHTHAMDMLISLIGGDKNKDIFIWAREQETAQQQRFNFRAEEDTTIVATTGFLAEGNRVHCKNTFVEEFVKVVSLSSSYRRHESVRNSFDAVVAKYFTSEPVTGAVASSTTSSALTLLMRYDCTLRKDAVERSHSFLREHLVDIQFRASMLEAYLQSYASMTSMFLRGLGNSSESIFDFAVQFLTVPHLVQNYTKKEVSAHPGRRELVRELLCALNTVFQSAVDKKEGMINADHPALSSQKYKHCVENLEYVFNIGTLSSELVCNEDNLKIWLSCLSILQGGDPQVRRGIHQNHVEYESDSWLSMFNLGIRVHSVFAISWNGFNPSLFEAPDVKVANIFAPIIEATLASSMRLNEKVAKKTLTPVAKLAMNTRGIGSQDKSIQSYDFNVTSQPTSLHMPLHRFLTAAVRHICISQSGLGSSIPSDGLLRTFGFDKLSTDKQWELVEMPLRCLVMASQIHSNLWRRNGDENMLAQLYNYSALPYCIHYRDADTLMLQLGVLMSGPDALLARMVDRFQLGSYFNDRGNTSTPQDLMKQFGFAELEQGIDEQQHLQMLEEFLRLVIVLGTSLPSATGTAYDNEFLAEEMLQQLCSKSQCFSKLFDLAILPSGQDDIPTARLEGVLEKVSNFVLPSGLEPGRYELKEGLLENYNPYFLHLNREAHELARDRWTTYRNASRQKAKKTTPDAPPNEPLKPAKTPVDFLRPVQAILTCESTVAISQVILWKVICSSHSGSAPDSENSVSDAVISTCLHLLVHGVHTASQDSDRLFWTRLNQTSVATSKMSVLHILSQLLEQATTLLDSEQTGTVEWLIWKITTESPACRKVFEQLANGSKTQDKKAAVPPSASSDSVQNDNSPPIPLEQRKMEARKRAMEAMAKRQAAFQAMIDTADDEEEAKKEESESGHDAHSVLGKRMGSLPEEPEVTRKKRREVENEQCYNCILCHDSSAQGQMGMAAYVHQSTVLAPGFRPEPKEALRSEGKRVRGHVKKIIEKMELCSGGSSTSSDIGSSPSPTLRAFSTSFPEWYMDGSLEDQLTRDNTAQNSPRPPAARRPRNDRIRFGNGNLPMLEGEMLQTDEELEVLEGVFDLQEDQQLFPMDMRGAVSLDLRGDRVEPRRLGGREIGGPRGGNARAQAGPMYDSDDEDASLRFRLERMPPGFGRQHDSAKLYLTPCGLHVRTCQHAVHINCLERYIASLHDKAMRGEEFDGVQAIDPDSAMTQFLCPLCKTLSNFLIPTSEPRKSIAKKDEQKRKPSVVASPGDEEGKTPNWDKIVEEQLSMPGWYRSVLGRDGGFEDDEKDTEHDMWRDYFEDTLWEPHGSLEKGAPFLWSACAYTLASFLTVADKEHRVSGNSTPFDPLTDPCPPSLEKELESLTSVTKFSRWTFSLLEHCADAKVIWETAKRCCPINSETKREYRKFTKVLGSLDACLRGTILGLLLADTFTAFVVASVIADELETIWRFIPVFTVADMLQRLHAEFFEPTKMKGTSLFQDKFSVVETSESMGIEQRAAEEASALALAPRRTRSGRAISPAASSRSSASVAGSDQQLLEALEASGERESEAYAALQLLQRMTKAYPTEKRKPLSTVSDVKARLQRILPANAEFVRRMKLFWRCLVEKEANVPPNSRAMQIPTLLDIAHSSDATFDQIWRWCMDRMFSKTFLGSSKGGDKCEHTEGCSEAYVASMFILRDVPSRPRLIDLPIQYDELYSEMAGRKCTRCEKSPCDPGLCLICGEFLCCGDSCCTRAFMPHGPPVGECTRHAAECGGGIGIVLLLEQCRIAVVGGSMAAYFPSPYVDSHGEEDVGLQRGRPLRLDMARYRYLESLWLNHRIFTEVSRQRNQRDPQYTINLSYL
ncbi:hypothetical protein V7S43_001356 [Phytophthora oleae]|uniref:E3 ubiquitin-protein ligase n=1 Tax=Phytophthora oleae TaxID=2107226 RepID=A0ABD3G618_9STRA